MQTQRLVGFSFTLLLFHMTLAFRLNGIATTRQWHAKLQRKHYTQHRSAFSPIQMTQTLESRCQVGSTSNHSPSSSAIRVQAKFIPESTWRHEAAAHKSRIESLLSPGLIQRQSNHRKQMRGGRSLDPQHPIYNFLIEYYGIKGSKGVNRLIRWCPSPFYEHIKSDSDMLVHLNASIPINDDGEILPIPQEFSIVSGVFLENATVDDVTSGILHLRGAHFIDNQDSHNVGNVQGILYSPLLYLGSKNMDLLKGMNGNAHQTTHTAATAFLWYRTLLTNTLKSDPILYCHGMHEWAMLYNPDTSSPPPPSSKYQSHLSLRVSQQIINEQVERKGVRCTHIDALRFFAPEAKKWNWYGSLDDLTAEEKGVGEQAKQHVQKLLDSNVSHTKITILTRSDQLHLEQKACLHANMDLFKIAWRLQPFISSTLLVEALTLALQSRTLDVEASPYDVSGYLGLEWSSANDGVMHYETVQLDAVKIETEEGRKEYQQRQLQIMKRGEHVRTKLLTAYNDFLLSIFGIDSSETGEFHNSTAKTTKI